MNRRQLLTAVPYVAAARTLLAAAGVTGARIGLCTFSCHQHWKAAGAGQEGVKFNDATMAGPSSAIAYLA